MYTFFRLLYLNLLPLITLCKSWHTRSGASNSKAICMDAPPMSRTMYEYEYTEYIVEADLKNILVLQYTANARVNMAKSNMRANCAHC